MIERPFVGVAVIVKRKGKVLLGKRRNTHGAGAWALPGGHLEFNEKIETCAQREVFEETGIFIKNIIKVTFTNDIFKEEEKHYVTLFLAADYHYGKLEVKEAHKCDSWEWFNWDNLPEPRFLSLNNLLQYSYKIRTARDS